MAQPQRKPDSDIDAEDGCKVVLSPVQLAAVLQGRSLSVNETLMGQIGNRAFGGLEMVAGAVEMIGSAALFLVPEPTLATKVVSWAALVNGADNASNGARELWTGQRGDTLTQRAATAAARSMGVNGNTANKVGLAVDILVGLPAAAELQAARVLSIRAGVDGPGSFGELGGPHDTQAYRQGLGLSAQSSRHRAAY